VDDNWERQQSGPFEMNLFQGTTNTEGEADVRYTTNHAVFFENTRYVRIIAPFNNSTRLTLIVDKTKANSASLYDFGDGASVTLDIANASSVGAFTEGNFAGTGVAVNLGDSISGNGTFYTRYEGDTVLATLDFSGILPYNGLSILTEEDGGVVFTPPGSPDPDPVDGSNGTMTFLANGQRVTFTNVNYTVQSGQPVLTFLNGSESFPNLTFVGSNDIIVGNNPDFSVSYSISANEQYTGTGALDVQQFQATDTIQGTFGEIPLQDGAGTTLTIRNGQFQGSL
jgi:hypothetical protein